jgi:hypothetical protein
MVLACSEVALPDFGVVEMGKGVVVAGADVLRLVLDGDVESLQLVVELVVFHVPAPVAVVHAANSSEDLVRNDQHSTDVVVLFE